MIECLRRTCLLCAIALAWLPVLVRAQVALPHLERFEHASGSNITQASADWSAYFNPGGIPALVGGSSLPAPAGMPASQGGSLVFQGAAGAEDVALAHVSVSVNRLYASFVCDLTPTVGDSFAIALGGGGAHRGRLFARSDAGGVRFGISKGGGVPEAEAASTVPAGEHFLVLEWIHGSPDVFSLFIDPDPTAPEPTPDVVATAGTDVDVLSEFRVRQDASGAGGVLDELRLGRTWASVTQPTFALHGLFGDDMVLQRGRPVPIWGTGQDGTVVNVSFAGQDRSTVVSDGAWRVDLASLPPGGPHTLTVQAGPQVVQYGNVLVGDVWVCSGQSNMRFELMGCDNGPQTVAASTNTQLRLCEVSSASGNDPLSDVGAGWALSSPTTSAHFSAVAWFCGNRLEQDLAVPIGLIEAAVSGTSIKAWMTNDSLLTDPDFAPILAEKATSMSASGPTARYNGMIAPLQPYAVRGVLWYQGEADPSKWLLYRKLFPTMIGYWRQDWGQGDLPFLYVQLASYGGLGSQLWPMLRESQRLTLSEPVTAMVVTMDVGDQDDIHPIHKQTVGERLALAARAVAHGEPIVHSGPLPISAEPLGAVVVLRFASVGGGLLGQRQGSMLSGFELAGADQVYAPALALIAGDSVFVTSEAVPEPEWVRSSWVGFPDPVVDFFNVDGLPGSPFELPVVGRSPVAPTWSK